MSDVKPTVAPVAAPAGAGAVAPVGDRGAGGAARGRLRATRALIGRELQGYFQTPVAYVVSAIFLVASALLFFSVLFLYDRADLRQFFGNLPLLLALFVPALAMRLIAEEKRRGTYEILATLPLGTAEVVIGKFVAVWITTLFMIAPTLLFALSVSALGRLDWGPVLGGYLGAILLAGAYGAIGVLASSLARSETVALVIALAISITLTLLETFLLLVPAPLTDVVQWFATTYHFSGFTRGVVDSRSILYFASVIVVALSLAEWRLRGER